MATTSDIPATGDLIQTFDPSVLYSRGEYPPYWGGLGWGFLRLDLIHPTISGNKWFKLKRNLQHVRDHNYNTILTFGGAYSNHLHATAAAANEYGLPAIGLIRGTYAADKLTQTLKDCKDLGMNLRFLTREEYAQKDNPLWLKEIAREYDHPFIIPEGGANGQGREGAAEIATFVPSEYTHVCVSVGTGTTFTGLRNGLPSSQCLLGFVPMIGGTYLHESIRPHLYHDKDCHWELLDHYNFGGFGKSNDELITFMNTFYTETAIPLDIVYTAKMMYGITELLQNNYFPSGSKILCIHTGGLQGNRSIGDILIY